MRTTQPPGSILFALMLALLNVASAAAFLQGKRPGTDTTAAPLVTKTKIEVQENGGEFKSPWVNSLTITSADTLAFRYSTNEPSATSAIWQVSDKPFLSGPRITAAEAPHVIASGPSGTVPAPGHVSQFEINFAQFASHTPPKSPERYYVRVVTRNDRQQPVGLPSSSVIITYREPPPSVSFEKPLELGSEYCNLSVRHPYDTDRCSLKFVNFQIVDPSDNRARVLGDQALLLLIKSAAPGKKYQVDCQVDSNGKKPFKTYGWGNLNQVVPQTGSITHVVFIHEAKNTDWETSYIRNEDGFLFFYCVVTNVK